MHGVPDLAREVEYVKEIVGLVAEPVFVDELSLIKDEPVRVQGKCRNPAAIRGSIEVFFNGVGKMISFEIEGGGQGSSKGGKGGPPGSDNPGNGKFDKDKNKHNMEDYAKRGQGSLIGLGSRQGTGFRAG